MAAPSVYVTPILGVNLTGNDTPSAGGDNQAVPRVQPLTTILLVGNRVAIYVQTKAALNSGTTVVLDTTSADGNGTVSSTSGTGTYVTLNATACASGDWVWAFTVNAP